MSLLLFLCDFTGLVTAFRQFRTEKRPVSAGRFRFDAKESQRFEQFGVRHFAPNGFRQASIPRSGERQSIGIRRRQVSPERRNNV